jgi:hypothetical protein
MFGRRIFLPQAISSAAAGCAMKQLRAARLMRRFRTGRGT